MLARPHQNARKCARRTSFTHSERMTKAIRAAGARECEIICAAAADLDGGGFAVTLRTYFTRALRKCDVTTLGSNVGMKQQPNRARKESRLE